MNIARHLPSDLQAVADTVLQEFSGGIGLMGSDGSQAFAGCPMEIQGQAGPVCEWCGLWKTPEEFYGSVGDGEVNWVIPRMGEIPGQLILSMWKK